MVDLRGPNGEANGGMYGECEDGDIGVRRGVSKAVEDGPKPPALQMGHP
jgi:hypothetical protein